MLILLWWIQQRFRLRSRACSLTYNWNQLLTGDYTRPHGGAHCTPEREGEGEGERAREGERTWERQGEGEREGGCDGGCTVCQLPAFGTRCICPWPRGWHPYWPFQTFQPSSWRRPSSLSPLCLTRPLPILQGMPHYWPFFIVECSAFLMEANSWFTLYPCNLLWQHLWSTCQENFLSWSFLYFNEDRWKFLELQEAQLQLCCIRPAWAFSPHMFTSGRTLLGFGQSVMLNNLVNFVR